MSETRSTLVLEGRSELRGVTSDVERLDDAVSRLETELTAANRAGQGFQSPEFDQMAREAEQAERATGGLSEGLGSLHGVGLAAGAAIVAIGVGLVAAVRHSAEFQRSIQQTAAATGAQADNIEGLARTFQSYGLDVETTSTAVRDFYERLGEARTLPDSGIGQAFRDAGTDINDANLSLTDFLEDVGQLEDRAQQLYVIRTILTGDSEELLTALADSDFQGRLEVNIDMALAQADRERLLAADAALSDAGASISRLVESLLSVVAPAIEGVASALASTIDATTGAVRENEPVISAAFETFLENPLGAFDAAAFGQNLQEQLTEDIREGAIAAFEEAGPRLADVLEEPLSEGARMAVEALGQSAEMAFADAQAQLDLLNAETPFERQRIAIQQNTQAQIDGLNMQIEAARQFTTLTDEQEAGYQRAITALRELEATQIATALQAIEVPLEAVATEIEPIAANLQLIGQVEVPDFEPLVVEVGNLDRAALALSNTFSLSVDQIDNLAMRSRQSLGLVRDGLSLIGVDLPREFDLLENGLTSAFDTVRGLATGDPFSVVAGGVGLLSSAAGILRGDSEEAARAQLEYARAIQEAASQANLITDSLLAGTEELATLQSESTQAFRELIDLSQSPGELRENIESALLAFSQTVGTSVADLAGATDEELIELGRRLGGLFEALGTSVQDIEGGAVRVDIQAIRDFAAGLEDAFGGTADLGSVIQTALTLDGALNDLTSTVQDQTEVREQEIEAAGLAGRLTVDDIEVSADALSQFQEALAGLLDGVEEQIAEAATQAASTYQENLSSSIDALGPLAISSEQLVEIEPLPLDNWNLVYADQQTGTIFPAPIEVETEELVRLQPQQLEWDDLFLLPAEPRTIEGSDFVSVTPVYVDVIERRTVVTDSVNSSGPGQNNAPVSGE